MQKRRVVAYYRVSTQKQGISGLGLEAQRKAVADYLAATGGELIAEFTEVESGRKANRPQLAAALAMAKEEKAVVAIAKLDRLARSVRFVSNLLDSEVEFVSVDMPEANRLVLHMMAAFAEHEAAMISQRTKAALAAAKARGVRLGENRERVAQANAYASSLTAALAEIRATGILSVRETAAALNARGILTRTGGQWHPTSVQRLLVRLSG